MDIEPEGRQRRLIVRVLSMSNEDKWVKALRGKTHFEAFKLIWDPKRALTPQQRKALVKLHEKIKDEDLTEKWGKPEAWLPEEED